MKLIALAFAILAAVPQALKWMAYYMALKMGDCILPAAKCLIKDNDQAWILNLMYGPNWFTTTGLLIGGIGFVISFIIMKVLQVIDDRKTQKMVDRGVSSAQGGGAQNPNVQGRHIQMHGRQEDAYGRMPRPPAFDKYGRPRE
jgi:hypothetical protein